VGSLCRDDDLFDLPGSTMTLPIDLAVDTLLPDSFRSACGPSSKSFLKQRHQGLQRRTWQRVGRGPHPNLLGGYLAIGDSDLALSPRRTDATGSGCCGVAGVGLLLLTFSRSALAVIAGGLTALLLLRRGRHLQRALFAMLTLMVQVSSSLALSRCGFSRFSSTALM
jgi:hypothetical protein